MGRTKRKSGIELLRIISMIQVIILHLYVYGNLTAFANNHGGLTNLFFDGLQSLCRMPVDVFILITGYFLVTTEFDLKRVFNRGKKIYLVMLFYSLLLAVLHFAITPEAITVPEIFKSFMPFLSKKWYFLSIYLVILLLSPFLNIMLQQMNKKQYLIFAGIVFMVMSIWSTLANIEGINKVISIDKIVDPYTGRSVGGQILLYIIGGYLRRFTSEHDRPKLRYLVLFVAFCATDFVLFSSIPQYGSTVVGQLNNPFVIGSAVAIFLFFRDIHFYSSIVNTIAGTTLGIYAIHEHPYIRLQIWQNKISEAGFMKWGLPQGYFAAFVYCIIIFVVCCLIDLLRQRLFDGISYLYQKSKNKKQIAYNNAN